MTKKIDKISNYKEEKAIDLTEETEKKIPDLDVQGNTVAEPEDPIELPFMNIVMKVKDYDQIYDILRTLPRAKSGSVTFTFGEEK